MAEGKRHLAIGDDGQPYDQTRVYFLITELHRLHPELGILSGVDWLDNTVTWKADQFERKQQARFSVSNQSLEYRGYNAILS